MPDKEQSTTTYPADAYQAVVAETHRLRAENERLRADKYGPLEDMIRARNTLATRVQQAEAENEQLREALLGIAESEWTLPEAYQIAVIFQRMARAALGQK